MIVLRGQMGVMPVSQGAKFPSYVEFLKTTTKADLPEPWSTTLWDKFGWTDEIHATGKTRFYEPFLVDGLIAYLISFNMLLKAGHNVADIQGELPFPSTFHTSKSARRSPSSLKKTLSPLRPGNEIPLSVV